MDGEDCGSGARLSGSESDSDHCYGSLNMSFKLPEPQTLYLYNGDNHSMHLKR